MTVAGVWPAGCRNYSDNQKTVKQEDDIKALLKCI